MNAVRLCFQCELEWDDGRKDSLSPVVSTPIYDKSETTRARPDLALIIYSWLYLFINCNRCSSVRGHHDVAAEDQLLEPVQRFLRWEDGGLHAV